MTFSDDYGVGPPVIELARVCVEYEHATPLNDVTHQLLDRAIAVTGPSGSGKSTLLRVLGGLQPPDQGAVRLNGTAVRPPTWSTAGDQRVAFIHQDYRLIPFLTVHDNIALAAEMRGVPLQAEEVLRNLLAVHLEKGMLNRYPDTLSGGEQQRVAICRALCSGAQLILADEPTGSLDSANSIRIADILLEIAGAKDVQVVLATHDSAVAERIGNVLILEDGNLHPRAA